MAIKRSYKWVIASAEADDHGAVTLITRDGVRDATIITITVDEANRLADELRAAAVEAAAYTLEAAS